MIRIFKASRFTRVDRLTKIPYASRLAQGGGMIKTQYINCSGWTRFICYNSQQKMLFWQRCFVPILVRLAVLNKFGASEIIKDSISSFSHAWKTTEIKLTHRQAKFFTERFQIFFRAKYNTDLKIVTHELS